MNDPSARLQALFDEISATSDLARRAALTEEALGEVDRDESPLIWANLHGLLASCLVEAAQGRYTDELFTKVLSAYQAALTVYTPAETPDAWRLTQRNVGATHLGALQSGLGDPKEHVEAAIAAYEKALELPRPDDATLWLQCQVELAGALEMAALWRGPAAWLQSARAYEAALQVIDKEASPQVWATLNLKLGSHLSETGSAEFTEEAIRACEAALEVLRAEERPLDWAAAHLVLGGLYRLRRAGDREENLERAVESLDGALSILTSEVNSEQWFRAHYHRGPAYALRPRGERGENLERALESLSIAIRFTSREEVPEQWASLVVAFGKAYLERPGGDREKNLETAITAMESALEVLPPDLRSSVWVLAQRLLGQAYFDRKRGEQEENIEKAITAFQAVRMGIPPASADLAAWCGTQLNLAQAFLRRAQGDPQKNRTSAIECLEEALEVPQDTWPDPESWSFAQAKLAHLYLDEKAETIGNPRRSSEDTSIPPPGMVRQSDPFGLASQAKEQYEALEASFFAGEGPLAVDSGWHVPSLLNEESSLLRHHLEQFLKTGTIASRTPEARSSLEIQRWRLFRMVLEHLHEKHGAARRTQKLFREVEQGRQGFVLFLRGFAYRAERFAGSTIVHGGGPDLGEMSEKKRLVQELAPLPLAFISNPVESGPLELAMAEDPEALGFRVESGATWETDVGALISAASFIIVHNSRMTPGVTREIELIEHLGRLEQTFFHSTELAHQVLEARGDDARALTDEAIQHMRAATRGRQLPPGALPAPTCRWIEGPRRDDLGTEIRAVGRWVERLARNRTPLSTDLELDAYAYLLATLGLLEQIDGWPSVLLALSQALRSIDEGLLPEKEQLAEGYSKFASGLQAAWEQTSPGLGDLERTGEALERLGIG